jgi:hypothetical protein
LFWLEIPFNTRERALATMTSSSWSVHTTFAHGVDIAARVAATAPIINIMIEAFEKGEVNDGTQAFQSILLEKIRAAMLLEDDVWLQVEVVGVHPDNREKAGIVPIDAQDLLLRISRDGFCMTLVRLLAGEIPPTSTGQSWRDFNEKLANGSNGFLPPVGKSFLSVVTVRGSHTTAAIRCLKLGAKSVHKELGLDGVISASKIIKQRPSMAEPTKKGMPYTVIKWQLLEACPKLMAVLSRTGNADHGVHRVASALQGCMSVFNAFQEHGDWEKALKAAIQGQPHEFETEARSYKAFVEVHAGGADGRYLQALELYERSLGVKRKILHTDLKRLSTINIPEGPRYVLAMTKALLNAPDSKVTNGYADLFSAGDVASLLPNGSNRPLAVLSSELMSAASKFLNAYCQQPEISREKYVSDFEVACVMHVHQIKVETRSSHKSLLHIAAAMYAEVKAVDPDLPEWSRLRPLGITAAEAQPSRGIAELREDGKVPDSELAASGFVVGADVVKASETDPNHYMTIESMVDELLVKLTVNDHSQQLGQKKKKAEVMEVSRIKLMTEFTVRKVVKDAEVYICKDCKDPSEHNDIVIPMWKGFVKAAMVSLFNSSSEHQIKVQRQPELTVIALADFGVGRLRLVALTYNVPVHVLDKKIAEDSSTIDLGVVYESSKGAVHALAKPCITFPKEELTKDIVTKEPNEFIVSYWAVKQVHDARRVNVAKEMKMVSIKVGSQAFEVNVPMLVNTKKISCGDEILVLKLDKTPEAAEEPDHKRARKGKGRGKGQKGGYR